MAAIALATTASAVASLAPGSRFATRARSLAADVSGNQTAVRPTRFHATAQSPIGVAKVVKAARSIVRPS